MVTWDNLDTLASFQNLSKTGRIDLKKVMSGENGAERVKNYSIPMAEGLVYNYAAKQVDDDVLEALVKLAEEAQLSEKFEELYNGAVINTGENRLVLHQLTRGQLGKAVVADGVDKRKFYVEQQQRIADFANKVHAGEITNAAGEKFTTVVQIGIGGSDLGPRAMYLALENWAKKNNTFKMEAKFISNVDPDDAAAVLNSVDVAHSIFVLVSKSGTTLETLTNESFVKDALKKAGLDASKHMIAVTSETSPLAKSDDYLAKPFNPLEVVARVNSNIRRFYALGTAELSSGMLTVRDLELDPEGCVLKKNGEPIELTSVEYRIMELFMKHPGKVFTKQQIYEQGWGDTYVVADNNIMVCISKLRAKLDEDPAAYIRTIRGLGYRLEK